MLRCTLLRRSYGSNAGDEKKALAFYALHTTIRVTTIVK